MTILERLIAEFIALFRGPRSPEEVWRDLDARAAQHGDNLEPRTSIVDLLKTLDMDSSFDARRVLWKNMGHAEPYRGSAEQNIELHRLTVEKFVR